jgi:GDSL-like Lipase/Acylhydrolase family
MRALIAVVVITTAVAGRLLAADTPSCAVPDYLLSGDYTLKRVAAAVSRNHKLAIAVLGTGSSTLAGANGPSLAYPARLEALLNQRLSMVAVQVASQTKNGQTADTMRRSMKELLAAKPDLVIWQTGTVDAIRRVEPDEFRMALETGVDALRAGGADVILMNMQYSPRTESMIALSPYADDMRAAAQQREVPLFDRFAIMRYWADESVFDFYVTERDTGLAQRVHECLGRALGTLVIAAAHLQSFENKTGK